MDEKKSGLAKAAVILVTVLLVSLGLCGVNFIFVINGKDYPGGLLTVTAFIELVGMAIGLVGLVIVGIIAIVRGLIDQSSSKDSDSVSIIEKDEDK